MCELLYKILDKKQLSNFFHALQDKGTIYAPVKQSSKTHSFQVVDSVEQVDLDYNRTMIPPKKLFIAPEETIFTFDQDAEKYIEPGESFMADFPFQISNPEDISLDRLVLVDIDKHKVTKIQVNIIYGTTTLPLDYILFQNYPNPFNPNTTVRFQVPKTSDVAVKIYDMLGQEVRTLFAGVTQRGTYTVNWDGLSDAGVQMSSGSYIYRMTAGEFVQSKKMILLK